VDPERIDVEDVTLGEIVRADDTSATGQIDVGLNG
jgi:hypothetical protein